jgi:hypothetical protein
MQNPNVQETPGNSSHPTREPTSGVAGMRSLSNTALVQEAARKALNAKDLQKTLERFRELCLNPGDDVRVLEETAETLRNAGFKQELMQLLRQALTLPETNPHVGALWIRRVVASKTWDHRYPTELDQLCRNGDLGHRALMEFLALVGPKRRAKLVGEAIGRHKKWLRSDPNGWAAAGRALVQSRCYTQAARWMSGWRKRKDLDLPTLCCLAKALRATGRTADANEVVQLALCRPSGGEQFPILKLWAAQDEALAGNGQNAAAHFKDINSNGWDDDEMALYYLVRGMIRVQNAPAASRSEAFATARDRVRYVFRKVPIYKRDVYLRREYRKCMVRMAKDAAAWTKAATVAWRSADSGWFLLPLLVVPGLQFLIPWYLFRLCACRKGVIRRGGYGPAGFSSKW